MFARLEKFVGIAAAVLLFLLMLVTLVDVAGRDLLNRPLLGATEMTEVLLVSITFLLYPVIAFREQHIVVDLIDHFSGRRMRLFQRAVTALIGVVLFVLVAWRMWLLGLRSVAYDDVTPSLAIPIGWVLLGMAVLAGVTALAFAALVPVAIRQYREPPLAAREVT